MAIEINRENEHEIVAELENAAGKATFYTIRDWASFEEAFQAVLGDLERRFRVPDDVDMRAIFSSGAAGGLTSELTFDRSSGLWFLEKVGKKRTSCPHDFIKYVVGSVSYEKFWLHVKDGRSMKSVECIDHKPLSGHDKLKALALETQRLKGHFWVGPGRGAERQNRSHATGSRLSPWPPGMSSPSRRDGTAPERRIARGGQGPGPDPAPSFQPTDPGGGPLGNPAKMRLLGLPADPLARLQVMVAILQPEKLDPVGKRVAFHLLA